jgi:DUF4097 and DUF4098 domain-containing protein YvlB
VLLAIGTVFLLVNLGTLNPRGVFIAFARFWPLLLILWGVFKLAEHAYARRVGATTRGLGFGGVFLLIVLLLFGSAVSAFHRHQEQINWGALREEINVREDGPGPFLGRRFDFSDTADYDLPPGAVLKVRINRGSLRVLPSRDGRVHARLRKAVIAYDGDDAAAVHSRMVPEILTSTGALVIDASRRADWAGGRLDMELEVPAKAVLDLFAMRGQIDVRGRDAAVRVEATHGQVTLEDVAGPVDARLHHAGFTARDIRGDVHVDGRINDTVFSRVAGVVELKGSLHGDVRADKVQGGVRIVSSRTDLDMSRLDGDLLMGDGRLRVNAATGPLRIKTHSQDIDVAQVTGDVKLENHNGEISFAPDPRAPLGNVDVSSRSGTVRLTLPAASAFAMDARTDKGEISSDFELSTARDGDRLQATGVVNKGGAKVAVLVEHGTIHLRRN